MKNKDSLILKKILDYQSAWETIQSDLPELQNEVERILRQMEM